MSTKIDFLEIFPCCENIKELCGGLDAAHVLSVDVDESGSEMKVVAKFAMAPAPVDITLLQDYIRHNYGLERVRVEAHYPPPVSENGGKSSGGKVLMGAAIKGKLIKMDKLAEATGTVTVCGEVFARGDRSVARVGADVLSFDITDYSSSVRVNKFIPKGEPREILDRVKKGMTVMVQGNLEYNKYEEDLVLVPKNIMQVQEKTREDTAEKKRVELHLHTRSSNMDALCTPEAVVALAARMGHKAVAVTDHAVAQSFPAMWSAGKKYKVKVIFGIEGYYVNDGESEGAVKGFSEASLDTEFVAFDIETTGLSAHSDRMTEIGAVIFGSGQVAGSFATYVNPNMPIPRHITELTGITDRDVFDAPEEDEAMRAFLEFVGDRPIIAHNASFDLSFMAAACERHGIEFEPVSIDTLQMSRALLPELKRHKLDVVSKYLGLPEFRHHRAADDAGVVARIMAQFLPKLKERGANTVNDINVVLAGGDVQSGRRTRHISILVRNKRGLKNLYKLISKSHLEHFNKQPIIPRSLLEAHREGLLIGSACEAGEVYDAVLRGLPAKELRKIAAFYDYLEIMPVANNRFLIDKGIVRDEEALRDINRRIARLAGETEKLVVATGDVHFLEPRDEVYRRILLASKKFSDADSELPLYYRTTEDMLEEFSYLDKRTAFDAVVGNTNRIADMCEEIELLPKELFPPKLKDSDIRLQELVARRVREIYGENPPEIVTKSVATELGDILGRKYDVIYMSAQELVADSVKNGYLVGSRGSVGSSIVAYLAGITEVNSLPSHYVCPSCKHSDFESGEGYGCGADMPDKDCPNCGARYNKAGFDIPFETFLGFGGDKVPDIDLNFSGEYQARAHKYTEELFGSDCVFRAGTIGTLASKTAYGYVKNYLEERGLEVPKAEQNRLIEGLVGVKKSTGRHPGGLVVIPQDMEIEDFCPVQHPADDRKSGVVTTHFDYHCMEDNLLKLDILGHDDPTMLKMLGDMTGVDVRTIPLDDKDTMGIFKSATPLGLTDDDPIIGKTGSIGIPEFGTGFTRQMLMDTKPEDFDTLVKLSGFSHGTDVWLGNAKDLIMNKTASVKETVSCRDDIMLYLIAQGMEEKRAFKIMEAVRKGRGLPDGAPEEMKSIGVPEWYIESCQKIKYLFPKAHAVAYVIMAFRIAYFKVHHPLAFYSAHFYRRSQKDAFDAVVMAGGRAMVKAKINEITKKIDSKSASTKEQDLLTTLESVYEFYLRGFTFAPVNLYKSDARLFNIEGDDSLRLPFISVAGLGDTAASDLQMCGSSGLEYISVEELSDACTKVSRPILEQLRNMGALGDMPEESQMSLF